MDDRVLWITGGGSGMGEATARAAASNGWTVVVSGRRAAALDSVVVDIRSTGGEAFAVPLDVRDPGAVRDAADTIVADHGRLDGLVLAAGLNTPNRRWSDQSLGDFRDIVDTNLTSVVAVVDAALPALRASAGVVVVVSSFAGWSFQPAAGVAYSATKTALGSVVRTLNDQEAVHGVRACHMCPGDVATDFLDQRPTVPGAEARAAMLTPDDIGDAVRFVIDTPSHVRIDELVISPVYRR
ncbi:SDR family oxidoreductase [Labedella populi]|uniref:SDR family oxidoreductase n=1 Tax=Labedella populi TaxID=2498850 RepID=A0A3S5CIF7_9MICO|nr:SDR family oxidoreductase [Labedella populi]RWZ58327.1 SDR family oxidoreductase [Labedella populi]